ncbi:MAG: DUF1853 family protein [Sneathiellales bacterium]|nr:DUF1853 family protein [Sneathiellales bacterium]
MDDRLEAALPYIASDLDWVINSPPLLNATSQPDLASLPQSRDLVQHAKDDPSSLLADFQSIKRHTLGTYFETLVFYWLSNLPDLQIIEKNLQIRDEKRTIGELDVLFRYQGKPYHWELAVKYYALVGDSQVERDWVGPLKKDTLGRKLTRLFDHQIPLVRHAKVSALFSGEENETLTSHPFVKGVLFSPLLGGKTSLPERVSPSCQQGKWLELDQLRSEKAEAGLKDFTLFCNKEKPRWFSQVLQSDWQSLIAPEALHIHAKEKLLESRIPQLYLLSSPSIEAPLQLFIMPNGWKSEGQLSSVS